jgi:hypothetical protein
MKIMTGISAAFVLLFACCAMGSDFHAVLELRNGVVHMPIRGPHAGVFSVEELGLEAADISIDYDPNAMFVSISGGADGLVATGWVLKDCCHIFRQRIFEAAIAEADKPAAGGFRRERCLQTH